MKNGAILTGLACVAFSSCDQLKDAVVKAKETVAGKIEIVANGATNSNSTTPDPELQALVDQSPDGYIFRKDLPFPAELNVRVSKELKCKGRSTETSLLGKELATIDTTSKSIVEVNRSLDTVVAKLFATERIDNSKDPSKAPEIVAGEADQKEDRLTPKLVSTLTFYRKADDSWEQKRDGSLKSAMAGRTLIDQLGEILSRDGLAPRKLWFGKQRLKIGTEITLTGDQLRVIIPSGATGKLTLKLLSIEGCCGHPCGVFSISGDFDAKETPDLESPPQRQQISIESGKIWLSLLYPLVLKEDLQEIVSFTSGETGSVSMRGQGAVTSTIHREWKPAKKLVR